MITIDAIKIAYRQSNKDGFVVTFSLHPSEGHDDLAKAPLGSQWQLTLVPLDENGNASSDDDPTSEREEAETKTPASQASSRPSKSWHELKPATQAGILCNDPAFHKYLQEHHAGHWKYGQRIEGLDGENLAAFCVRKICDVASRSDITDEDKSGHRWRLLASSYRAWMKEPEVV